MTTPAISKKTWLGLAIETTPGTAVLTPVRYIPTKSGIKGERKPIFSDEDRGTRDKNFVPLYGPRQGSISAKGRWFNDSCPIFLYGAMGGYAVSQPNAGSCPTVYKHAFSMADVPPVFTLTKSYVSQTYYNSYSAVSKFSLKLDSSKDLTHDTEFMTRFPVPNPTPPTPTFTANPGFAGYAPTFTLTSLGSSTTDIVEFSLSFEQKIETWTPASGVPDYSYLYFGDRSCTVDFTARFDVTTLFTNWQALTQDSITFDVLGSNICSTYNQELNIALPNVYYDSLDWDESKTNVMVKVKATVVPDPTLSQALMSAYVINTVPTYALG
jgi:hypothetical protein